MRQRQENGNDDLLFICFPLLLLLPMDRKVPGLTEYTFQQVSLPYQQEIQFKLEKKYWKYTKGLYG